MLGLRLPTDPRWTELASVSLEEILSDHAYCEQKAASTCISLIQQYPEHAELVDKLSPVVSEEWGHFRAVLEKMRERGMTLGRQRTDEYVRALQEFLPKEGSREKRLMERLLMAALIEARSCERFRLLSENLSGEWRDFYRGFMISEAGHYRLFIDLAKTCRPEEEVLKRWKEWLDYEAGIIKKLPPRGDRMH